MQKFSVLMSLYDKERPENLCLALNSLCNQTLPPDQIVMVYDGPITKELEATVDKFINQFKELKVVKLKVNKGLGKALSYGVLHCSHELIARMDTDDICYPNRFEKQINHLIDNANVSVLGCTLQEFEYKPNDLGIYRKLPTSYDQILRFAKYRNPLNHPIVVFRKSHILSVGSYKDMPLFEDYFLWIRLLQKGHTLTNLGDSLLHFRIGNDMIGRRHGISYLKKEFHFLRSIKNLGFITTKEYIFSILVKAPLRILPKIFLKFIYKNFLR